MRRVGPSLIPITQGKERQAMTDPESTNRATVIVSGGAAVSPFTTPEAACTEGLAAGNTDTFLREGLLAAGYQVFTSPARIGAGEVAEDPGWQGFANGPTPLAADMTVNAVGDIDNAGAHLARFLGHLEAEYNITTVDIVGHSMGGLFSRAAIRVLQESKSTLHVRTLTTIGTPWTGAFAADFAHGDLALAACNGDPACEAAMTGAKTLDATDSEGAGQQVTQRYLAGETNGLGIDGKEQTTAWNDLQQSVLANVPVVTIGGNHFDKPGLSRVWPHDGLVALQSALADNVSEKVLSKYRTLTFPNVHSIFFANALDLPWDLALTWNPLVLEAVIEAIENP
jgi:pimeloyl-ACP methyl ester carboxylesterase